MSSPTIIQPPLPIRVFNPGSVAIFASVSIHTLLLLVALPSLSKLSSQLPDNKRNVGVIQLNDAEQARLLDLSPPAPTPTDASSTPLIDAPISDTLPGTTSLPPLSDLPPLPSMPSSYPALPPYPSSFPPLPPNTPLPMEIAPNSYPLANIPRPQLPLNPANSFQNDVKIDRSSLPFTPTSPNLNPEDIRQASQNASTQRQREIYGQPQQTANLPLGNPNNGLQSPTALSEQNRRDLIARRLVTENLKRQEGLRYNAQNTTDEEAIGNDLDYQKQSGTFIPKDKIVYIAATYPKDACLKRLEGISIYGVSGNQPPVLIKSSGYPLLNQYAQQVAQVRSFSGSTRVAVTFKFDPKVCPGLSIPTDNEPAKPSLPEKPAPEVPAAVPSVRRTAPETPVNTPIVPPKPAITPNIAPETAVPSSTPAPPEAAISKPSLPEKTPEAAIPSPTPVQAKPETSAFPPQAEPEAIAPPASKKSETTPLGAIAPKKTDEN